MASLMENLVTILEQEDTEYQRLTTLSEEKRQVIIDADIPALEEITGREQEVASRIRNLENKREEVINDMSIVLSRKASELTITNMIAFLDKQPQEQDRLKKLLAHLRETIDKMARINEQNNLLLQQALEMVEFDLTLFRSMRQAPTTANYDKHACNTGELLGNSGFDLHQ